MKSIKRDMYHRIIFTSFMLCMLFVSNIRAQEESKTYYISETGNDVGIGSSSNPFQTIKHALSVMKDNDELVLKNGTYNEVIAAKKYTKKIRISAENEGEVTIDLSKKLPSKWIEWKDGIWKVQIDFDVWQLFHEDTLVQVARWPNAGFEDNSIWRMTQSMRTADGGYNFKKNAFYGKCSSGVIYDAPFTASNSKEFSEGDGQYHNIKNTPSLAESNIDFTGAIAVLNIGHWLTWTRPIKSHSAGSDHFTYENPVEDKYLQTYFAWYILGLQALDIENEWWFDKENKTVYYKPPAGSNPNKMNLRVRSSDFALELTNSKNITLKGIEFFGAGYNVRFCENITIENCIFKYPSTNKFMLGHLEWFTPFNTKPNKMSSFIKGANNRFINCEVAYSNAPIYFEGEGMLVENCYFHDIEWDMNSNGSSGSVYGGQGIIFRQNTICRAGNSEGLRLTKSHGVAEYNHLYDLSNLQHDGSGINVGTKSHYGSRVSHNWVHDCNRQGIRFDYHGFELLREDGEVHGDGVIMNNVTWNTQINQIKGDRHLVLNNTIVNSKRYPKPEEERVNTTLHGYKCMHGIDGNESTLTRNNIANLAHRSWYLDGKKGVPAFQIPGQADHNVKEAAAAHKYLNNVYKFDFRPKKNSPLVDAGATVRSEEIKSPVANYAGLHFVGQAPDIGAYEYGDAYYWIPGRKEKQASFPIPMHGDTINTKQADLMFRNAYKASGAMIYIADNKIQLEKIKPGSKKALVTTLSGKDNVVNLFDHVNLKPNTSYYWRVDAITPEGITKGKIWKFTTSKQIN
ncbi:right-handed parallel beta-helix repeat-containing protein [Carboxylicivirga marina]|uniref:Right-handed parallel beta-helix repeat-containing protein n=1 Tax=Carboxylicivirga marina TaxID=2800988 RepID=A0ABS1HIJ7_9BACT|nr:right-handed parallel beta-helix repeat-containing protein [Carboxylicivirga marina]MBK3517493.1 right-handed parallel beta-helix repeat-containing protein [Carboxylicivirga marina]